jgi:hypothetical protein
MPIAFPRATGPVRSYIESKWWAQMTKCFDAVPAPNLGRIGYPLQTWQQGGAAGWSLDPGIGVSPNRAVNVRRFSTMYQAPDQTARVNPAAMIDEQYDETKGFDRDLGQQSNRIVGVSRNATGVALGNCVVKVFATADDTLVASTTSDGSGNWTAYPNAQGPYYFVEYKTGSPDVFGTSPNTNAATQFTPGG